MALPTSYSVEKMGNEINFDAAFGSYHSKVMFTNERELRIVTNYSSKAGVYAPGVFADYARLQRMVNNGAAYDKIVLIKKSQEITPIH